MRGSALLLTTYAFVCGASCGDSNATKVCCTSGQTAQLRDDVCLSGEITQPLDRCMARDAGSLCGNGLFESALEQCEPTSPLAPACAMSKTCQACQCVTEAMGVCGNGTIEAPEQCETTPQCNDPTAVVCRGCACVYRQMPVTFTDSSESDRTVAMGFELGRVEMVLKGPPNDSFTVIGPGGAGPGVSQLCLVIHDASAEVQRICVRYQDRMPFSAFLRDSGGERPLPTEVRFGSLSTPDGKAGKSIEVLSAVGVRFERALSFHWESAYDGVLADRLPDTGEISFTEIMGRE